MTICMACGKRKEFSAKDPCACFDEDEKILLATALLLLRDYRGSLGVNDHEAVMTSMRLARQLGLAKEFNKTMSHLPAMKITPR